RAVWSLELHGSRHPCAGARTSQPGGEDVRVGVPAIVDGRGRAERGLQLYGNTHETPPFSDRLKVQRRRTATSPERRTSERSHLVLPPRGAVRYKARRAFRQGRAPPTELR